MNKDSKKAERIRLSAHSTTAGVTTCTIATNGRALPMFGTGAGTTSGFRHDAGDPIGCVTNHEGVSQINDFVDGTNGSGANDLRIGDETDSNVTVYAQNSDTNKPYLRYDAASSTWVFSNDGTSSTAIGNGASVYTGGDGISVTASDIDVDLTDTVIFKDVSAGAGDSGKVITRDSSGKIDLSNITTGDGADYITGASANVTGANLSLLTGGGAASSLHTHYGTFSGEAGEDISAGSSPLAVFMAGTVNIDYHRAQNSATWSNQAGSGTARDIYGSIFYMYSLQIQDTNKTTVTSIQVESGYINFAGMSSTGAIELYALDGSNEPTGSALATASISSSNTAGSRIEFASEVTLDASTDYGIVFKYTSGAGGSDKLTITPSSSTTYGVTIYRKTTTDAGTTWTDVGGSQQMRMQLYGYEKLTAGKLYISDKDESERAYVDGFAHANYSSGDNVIIEELAQNGFSSLTAGTTYKIGNSGAIESGNGIGEVGRATSASDLDLMLHRDVYIGTTALGTTNASTTEVPELCNKIIIQGGTDHSNATIQGQVELRRGQITTAGQDFADGSYDHGWSVAWSGDTLTLTLLSGATSADLTAYFYR